MFHQITDIHLSLDAARPCVLFPGQTVVDCRDNQLVNALRAAISESGGRKKIVEVSGFSPEEPASRWRVQQMREGRYALRRMRAEVPALENLGIPQPIVAELLSDRYRKSGGLIMIFGLTGAGKTTTFSATISSRLKLHGGYGLTIEDPIEDRLEGVHGVKGYCEQIDAEEVGGYGRAIHAALRCFPAKDNSILGYGEVRDAEAAAHLLRVAVDGHLVIFTCHSRSIGTGLSRIVSLAQAAGESNALELLASSYQLAIHQKFINNRLQVACLPKNQAPIKAMLKDHKFDQIDQRTAEFMASIGIPISLEAF